MSKPWRILIKLFLTTHFLFGLVQAEEKPGGSVVPEVLNLDELVKDLRLTSFKGKKFTRKIKVAILENGFNGYEAEIEKKTIPKDTQYHKGACSEADFSTANSFHGTFLGRLVAQLIAKSGAEADYEMHFFNASGITKFKDAVENVVKDQFDIVLYAQVWEYGGNGDGKGFINAIVDQAVNAGVIWINAAGNFGRLTRIAPVDGKLEGTDEWVVFKTPKGKPAEGVDVVCRAPKGEQCDLRAVLTWNDFKAGHQDGTDKDLDFFLYETSGDKTGKLVVSRERRQILGPAPKEEGDPCDRKEPKPDDNKSYIPRELVDSVKLAPGTYRLKVKIVSKNFSASQDKLRITVSGLGIEMRDPSIGETLLPPADNPKVIAIGASDDVNTNVSKSAGVPSIYLKSVTRLNVKADAHGRTAFAFATSNAAAEAAAVAILNLGLGVEKTKAAIEAKLKLIGRKANETPVVIANDEPGGTSKPGRVAPPRQRYQRQAGADAGVRYRPREWAGEQGQGDYSRGRDGYQDGYPTGQNGYAPNNPNGYDDRSGGGGAVVGGGGSYQEGQPIPGVGARAYLPPPGGPAFNRGPGVRGSCYGRVSLQVVFPELEQLLAAGAVAVNWGGRAAIVVSPDLFDFWGVWPEYGRRIFISPQGVLVLRDEQVGYGLPPGTYEVISQEISICR